MCYVVRIVKQAPRLWSEEAMTRTSLRAKARKKPRKRETVAWCENLWWEKTPSTLLSLTGNMFLSLAGLSCKPCSAWGIAKTDPGTTNGKRQKV